MTTLTLSMLVAAVLIPASVSGQDESEPAVSLHVAALQGNLEAVRRGIAAGANLNEKDAYGSTPLVVAVTFGRTAVAQALIDAGADLQITNNDGSTPLHAAAFLCRVEIVEALLKAGADKNARDSFGNTPLQAVSAPFEQVKGVYDRITQSLAPLGLTLDYEYLEATRPRIAAMLRAGPEG